MRKSPYAPEKRTKVIELASNGMRQVQIAEELNIPIQTVNNWINSHKKKSQIKQLAERGSPKGSLYASITFGAALAELRHQRDSKVPSTDDFARRIGIAGSTLRMLEAGDYVPQINIAYQLARECRLSLPMTVLIIGFVRAFDDCKTIEEAFKIATEFGRQEPRLSFFVNGLIKVINDDKVQKRAELLKNDTLVAGLLDLMKSRTQYNNYGSDASKLIFPELSPVMLDAIKTLISKLQIFQPALDYMSLDTWENVNKDRIRRVWSYYKETDYLLKSIPKFTWEFLNPSKSVSTQYIVLTKNGDRNVEKEIRNKLTEKSPNLPAEIIATNKQVLPKELNDKFEKALWFDISAGTTCIENTNFSPEKFKSQYNDPNYIEMTSLLLYEITDDITRLPLFCAFIDNSRLQKSGKKTQDGKDTIFYSRALKSIDSLNIWSLFDDACKKTGIYK